MVRSPASPAELPPRILPADFLCATLAMPPLKTAPAPKARRYSGGTCQDQDANDRSRRGWQRSFPASNVVNTSHPVRLLRFAGMRRKRREVANERARFDHRLSRPLLGPDSDQSGLN